jgi:addiction module RelB/DinJ family antitoxin
MTTVISIRLDKDLKEAAQEVAKSMGLPLSTLISSYLHQVVATRQVTLYAPEQMTPHLEKLLEDAEKEESIGPFDNVEDALAALKK